MIQLIKNDISTGRYHLISFLLYIPFIVSIMIMAMIKDHGGILSGFFLFVFISFCSAAGFIPSMVDSTGNGDVLRVSMPVRRHTLVLARYAASFLAAMAACLTGFAVSFAAVAVFHIDDPVLRRLLHIRGMAGLTAAVLIFVSYGLPFWFRYAERNPIIKALFAPALLLLAFEGMNQLSIAPNSTLYRILEYLTTVLNKVRDWIFGSGISHPLITILVILGIITLFSLGSSIMFYRKRDI